MVIMNDYQIFFNQEYGGVSRYHIELAKALNNIDDTEVAFSVACNINEYLSSSFGNKKIQYSTNSIISKAQRQYYKFLNQRTSIRDSRYADVVHVTWTDPYINSTAKGKMVVTIHDMIHEIYRADDPKEAYQIKHKKQAIYDSTAIIAISDNTKKDIIRFYPDIPESKIYVIYHGTNHLPGPKKPQFIIPEKYLLFVGKRNGYKRFSFMLEAISALLNKDEKIKLLAVGGGRFSEDECEALRRLKLENSVFQINASDAELAYLYGNAICFVYPTLYEGFGFPILEAFDNSCPVICTNSSSLPEVGGNAAIYFSENNRSELSEAIEELIIHPEKRELHISLGKERIKQFSWGKCAEETLKVYKDVLDKLKT